MQSFSAMRQALASLVLRGPKASPKKSGGGKGKDTGALKKKKVVKKAVVKESSKTTHLILQHGSYHSITIMISPHKICSRC
jgi:hypothetical protein